MYWWGGGGGGGGGMFKILEKWENIGFGGY